MKFSSLILLILFSFSTFALAQEVSEEEIEYTDNELKLNEIRLNVGYTILGIPELTYERILNDGSSIGLSFAYATDKDDMGFNYVIHPFYRLFFSDKPAAGFFFEGTGLILSEKNYDWWTQESETVAGFGVGVSIGIKLIKENGWHGELLAGFSRNLTNDDTDYTFFPRFGVSVGKRFY